MAQTLRRIWMSRCFRPSGREKLYWYSTVNNMQGRKAILNAAWLGPLPRRVNAGRRRAVD